MAVRLLAADWAETSRARCLLVVNPDLDADQLANLGHWLTLECAPPLTGQVIDLAAVSHGTLRIQ